MVEENRKLTLGNIVVILVLGGYCGGSFVSLSFSLFTQSLLSFVKEKKKATNPSFVSFVSINHAFTSFFVTFVLIEQR